MPPALNFSLPARRRGASFLLGQRRGLAGRAVRLTDRELFSHMFAVGTTGSGKTTAVCSLLVQAVDAGWGVVMIDLKADPQNTATLAGAAADAGVSYSQFSFTPGERCDVWQPLGAGDPAARMSKVIALSEWSEPYYKSACERFAQMAFVLLHRNGVDPSFAALMDLLDAPAKTYELTRALGAGERGPVERYIARLLDDKGQMSALAGLAGRIGTLTDIGGPLYEPTGTALLDLHAISRDGGIAVFSLDSMRSSITAAQIGALAALDVKSVVAHRTATGSIHRPMLVVIDEFSALGGDHVLSLFARARSARVGMLLATQELADLSRVDDGFADQILGLTNTKLVMLQQVPESTERLAMLAGTRTTAKTTRQRVRGMVTQDTGAISERDVEQFVVHPNQLRRLRCGEAVLIRSNPFRVESVRVTPHTVQPDTDATRTAS